MMNVFKTVSFVIGLITVCNAAAAPVTWTVDAVLESESSGTIQEYLTGTFTYDTSIPTATSAGTFTDINLKITNLGGVELFSYGFARSFWVYNTVDFFDVDPSGDLTGASFLAIGFNLSGLLDYSNSLGSFPITNFFTDPNHVVYSGRQECLNAACNFATTVITVARSGTLTGAPAIPIPAAIWLFGSGLIGLIGVARRKRS